MIGIVVRLRDYRQKSSLPTKRFTLTQKTDEKPDTHFPDIPYVIFCLTASLFVVIKYFRPGVFQTSTVCKVALQ